MKHLLNTKPAPCALGTSMILAYWGLRQEDWKLKASFSYVSFVCLCFVLFFIGIQSAMGSS